MSGEQQAKERQLVFTEEQLANLLASEYQRGYNTGIVIGRSGAQLEQLAHEHEQDVRDSREAAAQFPPQRRDNPGWDHGL